jgi:tellurium resistance protein TerD
MGVSLRKGGTVSLKKVDPGIKKAMIGLGWDARVTDGAAFDLDASVFMLGANGKVRSDADFIFYNNRTSSDGSIVHGGDNLTGAGEGDDEQVSVDLMGVSNDVQKLIFAVTIHDADERRQNFGMVSNAFIRVVNDESGQEIVRFDLSEDASIETAMVFGELYRHRGEWKFRAVEQGFQGGLAPLAGSYGVNV